MIDLFYPFCQPDSFWERSGRQRYESISRSQESGIPVTNSLFGRRLDLFLVGDVQNPELQYAVEGIRNADVSCVVRRFDQLSDLTLTRSLEQSVSARSGASNANANDAGTTDAQFPDAIILLESYPGEFLDVDVQNVRRRFPITPIVLVYSSWGAGETRTGAALSVLRRVSWLEAPAWLDVQLQRLGNGRFSLLSVPETASRSQLALWETLEGNRKPESGTKDGLKDRIKDRFKDGPKDDAEIVLFADSGALRSLFEDWGRIHNRLVTVLRLDELVPAQKATDSSPRYFCLAPEVREETGLQKADELRRQYPNSRILVYLNQPRWACVRPFYERGVDWIMPSY